MSTLTIRLHNRQYEPARLSICAWLQANNLDPANFPADAPIIVDEDARTITGEVKRRNEKGVDVLDHERNTVARDPFSAPLLVGVDEVPDSPRQHGLVETSV